jgi:ABC-type polysaccharide/polyol phosphate transport system ATPase subunit
MNAAIQFEDVSKTFRMGGNTRMYRTFRDDVLSMFSAAARAERRRTWHAVRDLSFEVPAGTALGIIGPNGSGKSTTLKMIAGILHPSSGQIRIRGRVGALIEVGAGIHPELTGRENIYMYGSILGLRMREIRRKFDQIVDFAEIGEFLDTPVKHYSSGMQVRLGFSVAANMDVDVLLVDEVLAVGDASFQKKCLRQIRTLRERGVTIVLVSHQLENIQQMCTDTVLLVNGRMLKQGPTPDVISAYYQALSAREHQKNEENLERNGLETVGGEELRITSVQLMDRAGRERADFEMGEPLSIAIEYDAARPVARPNFSVSLYSADRVVVTGADTRHDHARVDKLDGPGRVSLEFPSLGLAPGLYEVNVGVWDHPFDWQWGARQFTVRSGRTLHAGRFVLPHTWRWDGSSALDAAEERAPR